MMLRISLGSDAGGVGVGISSGVGVKLVTCCTSGVVGVAVGSGGGTGV